MHGRPRLTPHSRAGALPRPLAAAAILALAGCTSPGPSAAQATSGPFADSPGCADVLAAAPAAVLDQPRIAAGTPVPGVAVWGSPGIVLRCGAEPVGPSTLDCIEVDDVDWVVDDSGDPIAFRTYGRDPAVEVLVPVHYGRENAPAALADLGPAVVDLPQARRCVGPGDVTATP